VSQVQSLDISYLELTIFFSYGTTDAGIPTPVYKHEELQSLRHVWERLKLGNSADGAWQSGMIIRD